MKRFLLISLWVVFLGGLFQACNENDRVLYKEKPAVYFSTVTEKDSIFYSFASGLKEEDEVLIPIKIIGAAQNFDRQINFEVDPESTAKEGVHYKDLAKSVTLKAGSVEADIRMIVMDKELEQGDVKLILNLVSNDFFDLGYAGSWKAKLVITGELVKPNYWDMPLSLYYGAYSKAKHRLCIQIQGFDFPEEMDFNRVSEFMSYGRMVYNSLLKTPIWDEETQKMITADWSPL